MEMRTLSMFVMRNVKGPTQLSWRTAFNFHQSFLHSGGAIATHIGGVLAYVIGWRPVQKEQRSVWEQLDKAKTTIKFNGLSCP